MNEENNRRYYAYKGFDKDLKCRGEQFKIGETYTKDEEPSILRTCTSQGWHYCDSLDDVFKWYSNDGKNRFCQIEVLGKYTVDKYDTKATTTSFKILHEISTKEINSKLLESAIDNLPLEIMRTLQSRYPLFYGGSTALMLYGLNLVRKIDDQYVDLDIVMPYYVKIRKKDLLELGLPIDKVDYHGGKASGNDFNETVSLYFNHEGIYADEVGFLDGYLKLDIKIDPTQTYNVVKYKDYELNLSQIEPICGTLFNPIL